MPDVGFGGTASGGSFTAGTVYSDGIGLPSGRADCNGYTGVLIIALFLYVAGHSGNPVGTIQLGSAVTGAVTAYSAADSTGGTGWFGTNYWLVNGGTARIQWNGPSSGPVWVGRGGGGTVNGPAGWSRSGTLGGAYRYAQVPSQCGTPVVTPSADGTAATVTFSGPADNGGLGITNYILQRADNAAFTVGVSTVNSNGSSLVTGLTPGKRYYWRVTAQNGVTSATGALGGPWSGTATAVQPDTAFGMIRNAAGTGFVQLGSKIRSADNTAWLDADARIRSADNTSWLPVGAL